MRRRIVTVRRTRPLQRGLTPAPLSAGRPPSSMAVTNPKPASFRLTIETLSSPNRQTETLFSAEIDNPTVNEPIIFNSASIATGDYMAPLVATLRLVRGDATEYKDVIVNLRARSRKQIEVR